MDADILQVYKRLAKDYFQNHVFAYQHLNASYAPPDLCTAEMTTFLKETTNGN